MFTRDVDASDEHQGRDPWKTLSTVHQTIGCTNDLPQAPSTCYNFHKRHTRREVSEGQRVGYGGVQEEEGEIGDVCDLCLNFHRNLFARGSLRVQDE